MMVVARATKCFETFRKVHAYESGDCNICIEHLKKTRHKNAVSSLRLQISSIHMRESALLLGQYPNCFPTCIRGLMSGSDPILSHLLSSLFCFGRVPSFPVSLLSRD